MNNNRVLILAFYKINQKLFFTCISHYSILLFYAQTPSSEQNYKLMIREQGSRFSEKVRLNMKKKTAVFEVPAHRDFDHAVVMIDFNSVSKPSYFLIFSLYTSNRYRIPTNIALCHFKY